MVRLRASYCTALRTHPQYLHPGTVSPFFRATININRFVTESHIAIITVIKGPGWRSN